MSFVDHTADDILEWRAERKRALEAFDLAWARNYFPNASESALVIAIHKSRVECTDVSPKLRRISMKWLKVHGYARLHGLPWPKKGLPE